LSPLKQAEDGYSSWDLNVVVPTWWP
jgi:hypothetical protein